MTYKESKYNLQRYYFFISNLIAYLGISLYCNASVNGGVSFNDISSQADSGIECELRAK
jgi:hypothetical protein